MPVEFTLAENSQYDPDLKRLVFTNVFMPPPGNTLLLILMANGSYSGADAGPLAGQYSGTWPFFARAAIPITLTTTVIPLGGILETWPAPSPPYTVIIDEGASNAEFMTVTALDRANMTITVTRSAPFTHIPGAIIVGDAEIVDDGATPPLLNIPGEPTAAPARTGSWWAHLVGGSPDPSFALWQSRYWQSAPTLPVGHPVWATLSMVARKIDGSEDSSGLYDPLTNELHVAVLGAAPSPQLFQPRGTLLAFTETIEILPLPEAFGDIAAPADAVPTVPPNPGLPPFSWYYSLAAWTPRLVGTLPNNNEDLWLPILLSSKRSTTPNIAIEGWDDVTGVGPPVDYEVGPPEDAPSFFQDENWYSIGSYAARRQIGMATITSTHDPNPITYDLTKVGQVQSVANVPSAGFGSARVPCVGQLPWWELAGVKPGPIAEVGFGTAVAPIPTSANPTQKLLAGDVMVIVAQGESVEAPTDPEGWTRIDAVCGPNIHGHQPVTFTTQLWDSVLAGAPTIEVALNGLIELGDPPFTVEIEGGPEAFPPAVTPPAETLTATSCEVHPADEGEGGGYAVLGVGSVGSDHPGGRRVIITNDSLLAEDQYVAAWWKVAEGEPPDPITGIPNEAVEADVSIAFPGGVRCSARMYAIMADPTEPFSVTSTGAPAVARVDIPAPAALFGGSDVIPVDGITLRANIALTVGARHIGAMPPNENLLQDIRHQDLGQFMLAPVANPNLPSYSWNGVDPASVAVALCFAFRGIRERPPYELVDGHYAPSYANRGALPPCTGASFHASTDFKTGFGIRRIIAPADPSVGGRVLLVQSNMSGNARFLRAWVWGGPGSLGVDVQAWITVAGDDTLWFETSTADVDFYADPPGEEIYFDERPFSVRFITHDELGGYYGFLLWSEEDCQGPTTASYGLTAAFRYQHKELHVASSQQASIVG